MGVSALTCARVITALDAKGRARLLNFCMVSTIFWGSAAAPTAFMALVAVAMLCPTVDVAAVVCTRIMVGLSLGYD